MDDQMNKAACDYATPGDRYRAELEMKRAQERCSGVKCETAARELTVGESIERQIHEARLLIASLEDIKGSLSSAFLNSGVSRIRPFQRVL